MIKLTITPKAVEQIKLKMSGTNQLLKLKYETEGNGCVLNGVPMLEIIDGKTVDVTDPDHVELETNEMPVIMEKSKLVFFDKELKIDFSEGSQAFA